MALQITKENFQQEVMESTKPVLIDFWASWCGPCKMLAPTIDALSQEATDFVVGKVNVDEQPELAMQYKVLSIPTLIVMKDGAVVKQAVGVQTKQQILNMMAGL